jgi:hypothetical protein
MSTPPHGPYYSTWGPMDGPIRHRDNSPAIGVVADPGGNLAIGVAYPRTYRPHPLGSVVRFRLFVDNNELPGLWECVGHEFVPAAEWPAPQILVQS